MEKLYDIKGYEGLYAITKDGRVWSYPKDCKNHFTKGRYLKIKSKSNGYHRVVLAKDRKYTNKYIHRLVAQAFITNLENKPEINHINCIKTDNRIENLEWVTCKENMKHARENNLYLGSVLELRSRGRLTKGNILKIRNKMNNNNKYKDVAREYGISMSTVNHIKHKRIYSYV